MGNYERKDHYYRKAKEQGLPSRASFKIAEVIQRFKFVTPEQTVLDLGAAPGGWTVILAKAVGARGKVLAVDLLPLKKVQGPNIFYYQGDLTEENTANWIAERLPKGGAQCLCSDMSPNLSGIAFKDAFNSYELAHRALQLAQQFLRPRGNFIAKIFPGAEFQGFLKELRSQFTKVKVFEPKATRKTSREIYLLGLGFGSKGL